MRLKHLVQAIVEEKTPVSGTNGYPLQPGTVYGPIYSRRYGHSLGINPLPVSFKFCDFDCVYCQYGWTPRPGGLAKKTSERLKTAQELLEESEVAFRALQAKRVPVDVITIAGNGEPTLHPEFPKLVAGLIQLRSRYWENVPIGVLSDSTQCHRKEIKEALATLDKRCMKLDAADQKTIEAVNKPLARFNLERTLNALRKLRDITIQSMFVQGSVDNTAEEQIDRWIEAIEFVQPTAVQVYTIDRPPADSGIETVFGARLREIAERCGNITGISTEVFGS